MPSRLAMSPGTPRVPSSGLHAAQPGGNERLRAGVLVPASGEEEAYYG